MNKYKISTLDVRSLDNSNFAQLLTSTLVAITAHVKVERADNGFYKKQLPLMEQELTSFEAGLHQNRASRVAKKLEAADKERDLALTTVTKLVRAYSSVKTEPVASRHQLLSTLLKGYKLTSKTSYEEETEILRNLLKELGKSTYRSAISTLHLTEPIASLKAAQTAFETLYQERLSEQTSTSPSQTKALRKSLTERYSLLVDYTAVNAAAHPEKPYLTSLRDDLNTIRKRYKPAGVKQAEAQSPAGAEPTGQA